jgi:hypothetical protein
MLWYVRSLLGLVSAVCALLSPLCVIHWLCRISPNTGLQKLVGCLDGLFLPVTGVLDKVIPPTWQTWLGNDVSISQGVLSVLLTGLVIVSAFFAKMVQVVETRQKLHQHKQAHNALMRETLARRAQEQQHIQTANQLVLLLKHIDPAQQGIAAMRIEQLGCEVLFQSDEKTILLFPDIKSGLEAAKAASEWITHRLKQLRPMDAKPDYRFILHAIDANSHPQEAVQLCQGLEVFCQPPNILCTQSVSDAIRLKKLPGELTSLGYYDMVQTRNTVELFKYQAS